MVVIVLTAVSLSGTMIDRSLTRQIQAYSVSAQDTNKTCHRRRHVVLAWGIIVLSLSTGETENSFLLGTTAPVMSSYDPVSQALFPKARSAILGLLFSRPDRGFYLREIISLTGLGVGHVQRELRRLSLGGILRRSRQGRHVYFQADERSPVYEELRALVAKTVGAVGLLGQALAPLSDRIAIAFIYGSVARGEERSESDLDLMVIGDVSFAEVVSAIRAIESQAGRAINPTVFPPEELRAKLAGGHHFLNSVMRREKLFVVGNEDELGSLLEEQLDPEA